MGGARNFAINPDAQFHSRGAIGATHAQELNVRYRVRHWKEANANGSEIIA
jgi:hypothetical protein